MDFCKHINLIIQSMKKSLILLAAPLLLGACGQGNQPAVSGQLEGVESDTLLVMSNPVGNRDARKQDTVAMQQGKFTLAGNDSVAMEYFLFAKPSSKPNKDGSIAAFSMRPIPVIVLPGQPVRIKGSFDLYQIKGGEFYDEVNKINDQTQVYMDKLDSLNKYCMSLAQQKVPEDSIRKAYAPAEEWVLAMSAIKTDYIQQHPESEVAAYLAAQLPEEELQKVLPALNEKAGNCLLAPLFKERVKMMEQQKAREEAQQNIQPGKEAPAFTLKDLEGKDFSLASLKGKYVLLDFWGSWCGWCIKGIPDMKKAYEKHKEKMEIVGIDCRDTEDKWKKAVEEHQLPWINVRNAGEPDVAILYAVGGYPTKILVNPEGKIEKVVVGEDPALYTYLDELFK